MTEINFFDLEFRQTKQTAVKTKNTKFVYVIACLTTRSTKYINHKSNEISHIGHRIMRISRDLSNALTEYKIPNLKPIKSMFNL